MSKGFIHSVKVPRSYKESAKIVEEVHKSGTSFKNLVFQQRHSVQGVYGLVSETLQHRAELDFVIDKSRILVDNDRFNPWLARVLIATLLWNKKGLKSKAKPIQIVHNYETKLREALLQYSDANVDLLSKEKVCVPRYVRINTLLINVDEAIESFCEEGWNLLPRCKSYLDQIEIMSSLRQSDFLQDIHIPELLIFHANTTFFDHQGYIKGKLILQDKASCLPAFLLKPKRNSEILDMCAAPGMKTTHMAAIIENTGKIYAVEMNVKRFETLNEFITTTRSSCVESINCDALSIVPEQYEKVEYILVDPSCSGSGMIKRHDLNDEKQEQNLSARLQKLQGLQAKILKFALQCFPNVKKVAYSTCSIYPEENECVVDEALRELNGSFKLIDLSKRMKNQWNNYGSSDYEWGHKCLYARSDSDLCNGFFIAVFKRDSDIPVPPHRRLCKNPTQALKREAQDKHSDEVTPQQKKKKKPTKELIDQ